MTVTTRLAAYSVLWMTWSPVRNRFGPGYGEDRVIRLAITRSSSLSPGLATGLWRRPGYPGPGYPEYTVLALPPGAHVGGIGADVRSQLPCWVGEQYA
jgi:hypothetical protein